jgi:hypothetical protein
MQTQEDQEMDDNSKRATTSGGGRGIGALALAFTAGALLSAALVAAPAQAKLDLDGLLGKAAKVIGIKMLVDQFGDQIDDTINSLLDSKDVATGATTKVVTIITPLGNKHIGAAQVVGPKAAVDKVGAVVQLETAFMDKTFRIKALVPIEGVDPSKLSRVPGVGVSAVIDVKI